MLLDPELLQAAPFFVMRRSPMTPIRQTTNKEASSATDAAETIPGDTIFDHVSDSEKRLGN